MAYDEKIRFENTHASWDWSVHPPPKLFTSHCSQRPRITSVTFTQVDSFLLTTNLLSQLFNTIMSSLNHRSGKRRRRKAPLHYHNTQVSAAEERFLTQAIQNSKLDFRRVDGKLDIPFAPTFYPTVEEFEKGPMVFIEKIRAQAAPYGICKIVPPPGWNPPFCK